MFLDKLTQFLPISTLFPRAVPTATHQKHTAVISEGQPRLSLVHIHAVEVGGVFQGENVGAVLVELDEVAAMAAEKGKVGGDHDVLGMDASVVGDGGAANEFLDHGVLIDVQSLGDGSGKFQRVKLGLTGKFYPACHWEGQGQPAGKFPGKSQAVQSVQLSLDIPQVIPGVDIGVLLLIVAV